MERYSGRVAVVTGASAGIGAAIVKTLLGHGLTVVGLARRVDKIKALGTKDVSARLHAIQADVSKEEDILAAFKSINENFGGADILVNCAGVLGDSELTVAPTEEWKQILDINVLGLSICTREAVKNMLQRGVDDGFIVHISSIAGLLPPSASNVAMYCASKHAVQVLTEGLRKDLLSRKSKIRVTSICPGLVKTEIMDNLKVFEKDKVFSALPYLEPENIADAVVFALSQPPNVQVHELVLQPVGQGRLTDIMEK